MAYFGFGSSGQNLKSQGAGVLPIFAAAAGGAATAFVAYPSGNQNGFTGGGASPVIQYDLTDRNDSGIFNTGTGLCTVNKTGMWLFLLNVRFDNLVIANQPGQIYFQDNAAGQYGITYLYPYPIATSTDLQITAQVLTPLTSGQTMGSRAYIAGNATNNVNLIGNGGQGTTCFMGIYMGA